MAVEASTEVFNKWLLKKLQSFDVEDDIMASYISSVITTDDDDTDKKEVLKDIFQDLVQGVDTDALCNEILDEWVECQGKAVCVEEKEQKIDLGQKVSLIVERSVQPILRSANRSAEEEKLREAILSRCNYVSEEEEDCESDEGAVASSHSAPSQNQNAEAVAQAEKEKREKLKSESASKKANDKVNREKQKAKQDERREKERKRTQKQERRR